MVHHWCMENADRLKMLAVKPKTHQVIRQLATKRKIKMQEATEVVIAAGVEALKGAKAK
jgi:hypothetical protein